MVVELVSVGTELLLGNIVNTNTQFLAEQCALLGLSMYHQVVVGDNWERLAEVVQTALRRSDVVIAANGYRARRMVKMFGLKETPLNYENIRRLVYSDEKA